jgi:hypothetical protein
VPVRNGTAPALNDYKLSFLTRRWLQTLLGGMDLLIKGSVPVSVYIFQVFIFLVPGILGGIWTIIAQYNIIERWLCQLICGSKYFDSKINLGSTYEYFGFIWTSF